MKPAKADLSILMKEFENACRKVDLKVTHQRLELYKELAQAEDHPSAEMLYKQVIKKLPTLSLDTVYRTLATFEKHRLITKVQTIESQVRYEAKMDKHHHAVCSRCGTITDFTWDLFDEVQVPKAVVGWGKVIKSNAVFEGICKACAG